METDKFNLQIVELFPFNLGKSLGKVSDKGFKLEFGHGVSKGLAWGFDNVQAKVWTRVCAGFRQGFGQGFRKV